MTKSEEKCRDMADVCRLAHMRTVRECKKRKLNVNCEDISDCGDDAQEHGEESIGTHYGTIAQDIFNSHYDYICEVTGI